MNDSLQLRGTFEQAGGPSGFGKPSIPNRYEYKGKKIKTIRSKLLSLFDYWPKNQNIINGALIEIRYSCIVAKSNRIKKIFSISTSNTDSSSIVGAKFSDDGSSHIITHHISLERLRSSIDAMEKIENLACLGDEKVINNKTLDEVSNLSNDNLPQGLTRGNICQILVDLCRVDDLGIPNNRIHNVSENNNIVLFFDTGNDINTIANRVGISNPIKFNDNALVLDSNGVRLIEDSAPYLVAMSVSDIMSMDDVPFTTSDRYPDVYSIDDPTVEPVIGVIDTLFDERVYFNKWVEYCNLVNEDIPVNQDDKRHGTKVTSIIVDGARFNPGLDDGCGNFRVRHFAVGTHNKINVLTLARLIRKIVDENKDIHVWNLSLGDGNEISDNYISPIAALLDEIQFEKDVIFVVAGTNNLGSGNKKIGSPADSINSIVVNSVRLDGTPASYTRNGCVLSFFNKPDVCYYGGDYDEPLTSCDGVGSADAVGTSFAAPWIARKICYMIDVLGLDRETAKALLIDSCTSWEKDVTSTVDAQKMGFGIVPIHISNIIQTPRNEIRFMMSGESKKYDTYNLNIPVPIDGNAFPYISRATLCYFPKCNRNQGVDYTNTEMDIYFGRIDSKGKIKTINDNKQSVNDGTLPSYINEETARREYRKWDNVKHICECVKKKKISKKIYDSPFWGVSIKTKERLNDRSGEGIRFGLVVTLKEINGVNRIDDFIRQCILRGWIVNRINIDNRVELYNKMQEEVDFEWR